jgi:hypothetical protein
MIFLNCVTARFQASKNCWIIVSEQDLSATCNIRYLRTKLRKDLTNTVQEGRW